GVRRRLTRDRGLLTLARRSFDAMSETGDTVREPRRGRVTHDRRALGHACDLVLFRYSDDVAKGARALEQLDVAIGEHLQHRLGRLVNRCAAEDVGADVLAVDDAERWPVLRRWFAGHARPSHGLVADGLAPRFVVDLVAQADPPKVPRPRKSPATR